MRDMKQEKGLGGPEHWPELPVVRVPGDPQALPWNPERHTEDEIRDSWQKVAVLRIKDTRPSCSAEPVRFTLAFRTYDGHIIRLAEPLMTRRDTYNGRIGMRVGHEDVEFILIPERPTDRITFYLDYLVDLDDPAWKDLPLY